MIQSGRRPAVDMARVGHCCASKWEMGALPWWLLKQPGERFLGTRAPRFVVPARRWLLEVGRVLAPCR